MKVEHSREIQAFQEQINTLKGQRAPDLDDRIPASLCRKWSEATKRLVSLATLADDR